MVGCRRKGSAVECISTRATHNGMAMMGVGSPQSLLRGASVFLQCLISPVTTVARAVE